MVRSSRFRGRKTVSGHHIGARAKKVYACKQCHLQHQPGTRPPECLQCGGLTFTIFDSVGEAGRWHILRVLEDRGQITDLRRQVTFKLMAARWIEGRLVEAVVGKYIADFVYRQDGEQVIEDYKSENVIDALAKWKLRHMEAMGLPVKLVS